MPSPSQLRAKGVPFALRSPPPGVPTKDRILRSGNRDRELRAGFRGLGEAAGTSMCLGLIAMHLAYGDSAMLPCMRIEFTKMHGLGNDFVVFDAPPGGSLQPSLIRRLADRHTGIGFDQAMVLGPPQAAGAAASYRIFNRDGSEVEQCGNGARCVAALLLRRGAQAAPQLALDSPGGRVHARIAADGLVALDMGVPDFAPRALPFEAAVESGSYPLEVAGDRLEIGAVSVGNPHAVLRVPDVDEAPVATLGPQIEVHPRFPRRVNVGFMQVVARDHVRLRVFERGAGETLACGTGACAAVAVARRWGLLDADVQVSVRGGRMRVNWEGPGSRVWLTGPAEVSFEGHVEVPT